MSVDVLVIGAGPAGIASAYMLQQAGISYQVVDAAAVIASTWANQYPSLRLNTTRFYSHLPGRKFPWHYGIFPSAGQYHQYLVGFVQVHALKIQLGVTVKRVTPLKAGWEVETDQGVTVYPAVILATGRFPNPITPRIPGIDRFQGRLIHAHDYRKPADFAGQKVMVVGNGPSGVDISTELPQAAALPVLLAMRSGVKLKPRYPWGLPKHAWMLLAEYLPRTWRDALLARVEAVQYQGIERWGIKVASGERQTSAAATRGPELIHAARDGAVRVVDAPLRFDEHGAHLADGSYEPVDAVIMATGYLPHLACLDFAYECDEIGLPKRTAVDFPVYEGYLPHTGYEVAGQSGLYIAGVFYQGRGAMYNFNVEAEITVKQIEAYLPSVKATLASG